MTFSRLSLQTQIIHLLWCFLWFAPSLFYPLQIRDIMRWCSSRLEYYLSICRRSFPPCLFSGPVSWDWLLLFIIFFCLSNRVNGTAFDINAGPEACMFLRSSSFWQLPLFPRDCRSFRVYSMLTVPISVRAAWFSPCRPCSPFFPFCSFRQRKHTVETFPLHGSWIAFANFYNNLLWSLILLLLSVVILNICCTALTGTWRVVLL